MKCLGGTTGNLWGHSAGDLERLSIGNVPDVGPNGPIELKEAAVEESKQGKVNQLNQLIRPVTP